MEIHFAVPLSYLTTELCFYRKHHILKHILGKAALGFSAVNLAVN